ncbi:MAG: 16S rRNA (guanine(527)-N(7))-methyltransferase RsmG [Candidatus Puniceispirillaceae bacterium]
MAACYDHQTKWDRQTVLSYIEDVLHVSRETCDKLDCYASLLEKWQRSINLVSPKTISHLWERHILDCAQLVPFLPQEPVKILDLGSGAGLPAVIISALSHHQVEMVESDSRKCAFMQTALREMGLKATIHNQRLESLPHLGADIITARAFAPLPRLLDWTKDQHQEGQIFWLLKGRAVNEELTNLPVSNKVVTQEFPSLASGDGVILRLRRDLSENQ